MPMFLYSVSEIFKQRLNVETETVRVALLASDFIPDYGGMKFLSDIPAAQIAGTVEISVKEWIDTGMRAGDVVFSGLTGMPVNALMSYVDRGTPETSILLSYGRLMPEGSPEGDFFVRFSPLGLISWKNQPVFF